MSQIPYNRIGTTSVKVGIFFVEQSCKEQISDSKSFLGILPQKLWARTLFKIFRELSIKCSRGKQYVAQLASCRSSKPNSFSYKSLQLYQPWWSFACIHEKKFLSWMIVTGFVKFFGLVGFEFFFFFWHKMGRVKSFKKAFRHHKNTV